MNRIPSSPCFNSNHDDQALEVYVAARPFCKFAGDLMTKLSDDAKLVMVDVGVCHFMTIFKKPDGELVQFDFGPVGGDIHMDVKPLVCDSKSTGLRNKSVGGELREEVIDELPPTHMYVGRTAMTMDDIRTFNTKESTLYELNANDCRHYVNKLVLRATGFSSASVSLVRHQFVTRRAAIIPLHARVLQAVQHLTDVDNWRHVQHSVSAASLTTLIALRQPIWSTVLSLTPSLPRVALPFASAYAVALPILRSTVTSATAICATPQDYVMRQARDLTYSTRRNLDVVLRSFTSTAISSHRPSPPKPSSLLLKPFHYSKAAFASVGSSVGSLSFHLVSIFPRRATAAPSPTLTPPTPAVIVQPTCDCTSAPHRALELPRPPVRRVLSAQRIPALAAQAPCSRHPGYYGAKISAITSRVLTYAV